MIQDNESKTVSSASHSSDSSSSMNDASHYSATSSPSPYIHEIRDPNDSSIILCYISRSYDHHHYYTDVHQRQEQQPNSEEHEQSRRKLSKPNNTTFVTSDESVNPQIGFIVYPKDHHIKRHYHSTNVQRVVRGTPETLIIRQGAVTVHIYSLLNNSHKPTSGIGHQRNGTASTVSSTPVDISTNKTEQEQERLQFQHVTSETLRSNDVCILVSGGHGFTIESDDTVMLEIKQGPYAGVNDKVFF